MTDNLDIVAVLEQEGISVVGKVIRDSVGSDHSFVYIPVSRNAEGHQVPSNRSLLHARAMLKERGIAVEFILNDAQSQNIEAGVRATLLHAFGDDIRNVFLSVGRGNADVWVEQKRPFDDVMRAAVAKKATIFLTEVELELRALLFTNDENLPGKLALLKAIRLTAPAANVHLKAELLKRGFSVPSDDWLKRKLETLRKSDSIIRLASGSYVLPTKSFDSLGTVRQGRSPDVTRLLALAQKCR